MGSGRILTVGEVWFHTAEVFLRVAATEDALATTLEQLAGNGSPDRRPARLEQTKRARQDAEAAREYSNQMRDRANRRAAPSTSVPRS
jgi:hypothetical protein